MQIEKCRMCKSKNLFPFLQLGEMPPADQFLFESELIQYEEKFPLNVVSCEDCGLAQLDYTVPADILYCNNYPYVSSITAAGQRHWAEFASTVASTVGLHEGDLVIDVGSNVGVLLQNFKDSGARVIGIDPAENIAQIARANGIETKCDFFNRQTAEELKAEHGLARVITGTNVFAHIDDLSSFVEAVDNLLSDDGVLVVEAPYLVELLNNNEYDTIYHEHLSYLSLRPLSAFFHKFGMEIFEVQRRDIHGGSIRFYAQRCNEFARAVSPLVDQLIKMEYQAGVYNRERLNKFAESVKRNKIELRKLINDLKAQGRSIAAVSAPAKGMTLLNYCGLDNSIIDFVTEKTQLKIGRFTPGTQIPVLSDDALMERKPDYALLLAWNFADEIINNLNAYTKQGGKFIIPIPYPKIVG